MSDTSTPRVSSDVQVMMAYDASKKSTGTAYLLWFFLGGVGAHNFYLKRTGPGVGQLALFALGWLTVWFLLGFAFFAALGIWLLIDAFLIAGYVETHNRGVAARMGAYV